MYSLPRICHKHLPPKCSFRAGLSLFLFRKDTCLMPAVLFCDAWERRSQHGIFGRQAFPMFRLCPWKCPIDNRFWACPHLMDLPGYNSGKTRPLGWLTDLISGSAQRFPSGSWSVSAKHNGQRVGRAEIELFFLMVPCKQVYLTLMTTSCMLQ